MAEPLTPTTRAGRKWWRALGSLPDDGVYVHAIENDIRETMREDAAPAPVEWLGPCCTHPTPGCVVCGFIPEDPRRG